ncbi:sucrose-phosphatase 2-like isoform X2 [Impatiens glandulifera]|nr:sucrose-phosphatase 2-like isoform X2 [Impatiens glandulifera]
MLTPDITILSVGTEITYGNAMVPDEGWVEYLSQKWDKNIVKEETSKFSELTLQSETEQRPHKVSFHIQKDKAQGVMKSLAERLEQRGLDVKIIYSGGVDLDILPQGAGKGQALAYLLKKMKAEGKLPTNTLACGDSGNDAELFSIPDVYGVMVSNAQEELLQWHAANAKDNPKVIHATERCASGIIQAIGHFNLGLNVSPRDVKDLKSTLQISDPRHEVVKFFLSLEKWRRAETERSDPFLSELKASCLPSYTFVHPSGVVKNLLELPDTLQSCYGDKQGKSYRVWVDQISSAQIASSSWLVNFTKWELIDEKRRGCVSTVLLNLKEPKSSEGFVWLHIHQTWVGEVEAKDHTDWVC